MAAMRSWRLNGADAEVAAAVSAVVVTELARIETIERPAPPTPSLTGVGAPGLASVALCEGAHRSTERSDGAERPRHSAPLRTIMRVVIRAIAIERGPRGGSRPFNTDPRARPRLALGCPRARTCFSSPRDRRGFASGHQSRRVFRERRHATSDRTAAPCPPSLSPPPSPRAPPSSGT